MVPQKELRRLQPVAEKKRRTVCKGQLRDQASRGEGKFRLSEDWQ